MNVSKTSVFIRLAHPPTSDTITTLVVIHVVRHCCYTEAKNYGIDVAGNGKSNQKLLTYLSI